MSTILKPRAQIVKSNEARISELEQRCRFLEHNVATLAQALSADLERLMSEMQELRTTQAPLAQTNGQKGAVQ